MKNRKNSIEAASLTLICWLVVLGLGGGLLSLYYASIGYFPEVSWDDTLTYMAVLTILGGTVIVFYGFLLFVPGVFWSELLIHEEQLKKDLCFNCPENRLELEPCTWTVATRIGGPFALFMIVAHLLFQQGPLSFIWGSVISLAVSSVLCVALLFRDFSNRKDLKIDGKKRSLFAKAGLSFAASGLISLVALQAIYRVADPETKSLASVLLVCTLTVLATNLFVAVQYKKQKILAGAGSLLAAIFLLVSGDIVPESSSTSMPQRIMASYGIGGEKIEYSVLLNEEGVVHLTSLGAPVVEVTPEKTGVIEDVRILSKLGRDIVLSKDKKMYTVPKQLVIGFSANCRTLSDRSK